MFQRLWRKNADELMGMIVRTLIRKLLLGTASVLALGIMGQVAALRHALLEKAAIP
jgi:hypothetical protein